MPLDDCETRCFAVLLLFIFMVAAPSARCPALLGARNPAGSICSQRLVQYRDREDCFVEATRADHIRSFRIGKLDLSTDFMLGPTDIQQFSGC